MQRLSQHASIYTNNSMHRTLWHLPKIISRIQRNRGLMYKVAITENKTYETFCLKRNCSIFN